MCEIRKSAVRTSPRPKITFLIGSLSTGGAEKQLLELAKRLSRDQWQLSLVLFDGEHAARGAGIFEEVFSLDIPAEGNSHWFKRLGKASRALVRLSAYLKRTRP